MFCLTDANNQANLTAARSLTDYVHVTWEGLRIHVCSYEYDRAIPNLSVFWLVYGGSVLKLLGVCPEKNETRHNLKQKNSSSSNSSGSDASRR